MTYLWFCLGTIVTEHVCIMGESIIKSETGEQCMDRNTEGCLVGCDGVMSGCEPKVSPYL